MIQPLRLFPDEILRFPCRKVHKQSPRAGQAHKVIQDLIDTAHEHNAAGLAAPQIGYLLRICVVNLGGGIYLPLINPKIMIAAGEQISREGCLSIPGIEVDVPRPMILKVKSMLHNREFRGRLAAAAAHEIDHLRGVLILDYMKMPDIESVIQLDHDKSGELTGGA